MLQRIYDYSKVHSYRTAIFMIGAAHKTSIYRKIKEYERREELKLNWLFYAN